MSSMSLLYELTVFHFTAHSFSHQNCGKEGCGTRFFLLGILGPHLLSHFFFYSYVIDYNWLPITLTHYFFSVNHSLTCCGTKKCDPRFFLSIIGLTILG